MERITKRCKYQVIPGGTEHGLPLQLGLAWFGFVFNKTNKGTMVVYIRFYFSYFKQFFIQPWYGNTFILISLKQHFSGHQVVFIWFSVGKQIKLSRDKIFNHFNDFSSLCLLDISFSELVFPRRNYYYWKAGWIIKVRRAYMRFFFAFVIFALLMFWIFLN